MKIHEVLNEQSYFDPEIRKILQGKKYKFLGAGVDQMAFLEPGTGMILKIFGTKTAPGSEPSPKIQELTPAQKSFKAFADYCLANPDNQFLPQFDGWETFQFNEQTYLQIRVERLFEFTGAAEEWSSILARIANRAAWTKLDKAPEAKQQYIDGMANGNFDDAGQELLIHLGEAGFNQLWDTIFDLHQVAKTLGARLDLHAGNFMLSGDSHMVINDPFYTT